MFITRKSSSLTGVCFLRVEGWLLYLVAFSFLSVNLLNADSDIEANREYQIKAAFLFNFTKFIKWPDGHFEKSDSPIVIGVYGKDPFDGAMEIAVKGREVQGRPFLVKHLNESSSAEDLDVIFFPKGIKNTQLIKRFGGAGVLTVGESKEFAEDGGIISFILQADKVRFIINRKAAEQNGLQMSAQLVQLAIPYSGGER